MKRFLIITFLLVCTTACANLAYIEIVPKSSGRVVKDCFEDVKEHNVSSDKVQQFCRYYPYRYGDVMKQEELLVMRSILEKQSPCHLTEPGVNAFCERFNCGAGCLVKN